MGTSVTLFKTRPEEEIETKEKDYEGPEDCVSLEVEVVSNGWILRSLDADDTEYVSVYTHKEGKDLITAITEALGIYA